MDVSGTSGFRAREAWTNWYPAWSSSQIASEGMPEHEVFQRAWHNWKRASGAMPECNSCLRALDEWERVAPRLTNATGSASQ